MTGNLNQWSGVVVGGCPTGKLCYPTRAAASKAAKRLRRANGGGRSRSYRCMDCSYFHFGHAPQAMIAGRIGRPDVRHFVRLAQKPEAS